VLAFNSVWPVIYVSGEHNPHLWCLTAIASSHNYKTPLSVDWQQPCHVLYVLTKLFNLHDVVTRIEERISAWILLPPGNLKHFKLLNPFGLGLSSFQLSIMVLLLFWLPQKQWAHSNITLPERWDVWDTMTTSMTKKHQVLRGHGIATVLMYLSNVEKGGETIFPNAEVIFSSSIILPS
jgi:hypothetical protein